MHAQGQGKLKWAVISCAECWYVTEYGHAEDREGGNIENLSQTYLSLHIK